MFGSVLFICYGVFLLSVCVESMWFEGFEDLDVECFFVFQNVCVCVWDIFYCCDAEVFERVIVCVKVSGTFVWFLSVYKTAVIVDSEIQLCFRFANILDTTFSASDQVYNII